MIKLYTLGTAVTLFTDVKDEDAQPINATVVLTLFKPDGTSLTHTPTNPSTGHYEDLFAPDQAGAWRYHWGSTGAATVADDGLFVVRTSTAATLVRLEAVFARLGIDPNDDNAGLVVLLVDAISAEYRRLTRRDYEGTPTTYTERVRMRNGLNDAVLSHIPVASITSINRLYFDGSLAFAYETGDWRLEDPDVGLLTVWPRSSWGYNPRAWDMAYFGNGPKQEQYIEVTYVTTGEIPAYVPMNVEDWIVWRWKELKREGLVSYTNGADSETYNTALAGRPPMPVMNSLISSTRVVGAVI